MILKNILRKTKMNMKTIMNKNMNKMIKHNYKMNNKNMTNKTLKNKMINK